MLLFNSAFSLMVSPNKDLILFQSSLKKFAIVFPNPLSIVLSITYLLNSSANISLTSYIDASL